MTVSHPSNDGSFIPRTTVLNPPDDGSLSGLFIPRMTVSGKGFEGCPANHQNIPRTTVQHLPTEGTFRGRFHPPNDGRWSQAGMENLPRGMGFGNGQRTPRVASSITFLRRATKAVRPSEERAWNSG